MSVGPWGVGPGHTHGWTHPLRWQVRQAMEGAGVGQLCPVCRPVQNEDAELLFRIIKHFRLAMAERETKLSALPSLGLCGTAWDPHPCALPWWERPRCLTHGLSAASLGKLINSPKASSSVMAWPFHPPPNSNIRLPSGAESLTSNL